MLAPATVPRTGTKPGGFTALNGGPTVTMAAAIVPPERWPRTMTDAPSVMSLSSGPDMLTNVDAVVVTVTGWPLAVLMTSLVPFTCSSVPWACLSVAHPPTEVRTVPDGCLVSAVVAASPAAPRRTTAAAALAASTVRRLGPAGTPGRVRRGRAGCALPA